MVSVSTKSSSTKILQGLILLGSPLFEGKSPLKEEDIDQRLVKKNTDISRQADRLALGGGGGGYRSARTRSMMCTKCCMKVLYLPGYRHEAFRGTSRSTLIAVSAFALQQEMGMETKSKPNTETHRKETNRSKRCFVTSCAALGGIMPHPPGVLQRWSIETVWRPRLGACIVQANTSSCLVSSIMLLSRGVIVA